MTLVRFLSFLFRFFKPQRFFSCSSSRYHHPSQIRSRSQLLHEDFLRSVPPLSHLPLSDCAPNLPSIPSRFRIQLPSPPHRSSFIHLLPKKASAASRFNRMLRLVILSSPSIVKKFVFGRSRLSFHEETDFNLIESNHQPAYSRVIFIRFAKLSDHSICGFDIYFGVSAINRTSIENNAQGVFGYKCWESSGKISWEDCYWVVW